ncbi:MAG: acyl-ACP--UDP-N-acetylglucosamine O-acyltransferase [Planctomycetes bacterium]|nr:acyl-ACP--UDP-N-acetylglucosamine O-acyltransferase [Planctomycetota bacterium]
MSNIHPTAIIHQTAKIDPSVEIGPHCVIGEEVEIGQGTVIHNHVTIQTLTTIGNENVVYPFAVLGADPQDRKWNGERSYCVIGDRNIIREHVTIHRGTGNGGEYTIIGNDNLIMVAAHIAHDCHLANHTTIANQVMLAGHVKIEEGASVGGGAGIHHFATVGSYSFVGGLARISRDVPPYTIVEGNPAEVRALNSIAIARQGYQPEHIDALKDAFKRLFRDNHSAMTERIAILRQDYPQVPSVTLLCDSLSATADGVHGRALELKRSDDKRTVEVH